MNYGYLRETQEQVNKEPVDKDTGICRTCLKQYLNAIFPSTSDWIFDKPISKECRFRPDARSESLHLIIEVDGIQHYQKPDVILNDMQKDKKLTSLGYKVIRIPYFIQLTNKVVKRLFGVDVKESLFPEGIHSFGVKNKATPAYMCYEGIKRCVYEFRTISPEQFDVNIKYLKKCNNLFLTGVDLLEKF